MAIYIQLYLTSQTQSLHCQILSVQQYFSFTLQKSIIYKGTAKITNGDFQFTFFVPKDIAYNYGFGKISYYAAGDTLPWSSSNYQLPTPYCLDANGYYSNIIVGSTSDSALHPITGSLY